MKCCKVIRDNLNFCCAQVKEKFNDDLLIGTEHSKKIIPECATPIRLCEEMTQDEKVQIVLNDPKFGMFALFKWHIKKGYKNEVLKRKNAFYCSHTFSLLAFLPIIIFFTQWFIYVGLIASEVREYDKGFCPQVALGSKINYVFCKYALFC